MINLLVSIIMPAYNAQQYIEASITSVFEQSYKNWELIVVDDGSTDETAFIVKRLQSSNPQIKYHYQSNGKQGKARNFGIYQSRGTFLAFLDADDLWMKNKLLLQIENMLKHPEIDLIFTPGHILLSNGSTKPYNVHIKNWTWANDGDQLIDCNQIPILSVLVKKQVVVNVGMFTEEKNVQNAEDYHLWLKILNAGYQFKSIKTPTFYYRVHNAQTTHNSNTVQEAILSCYVNLVNTEILNATNPALRYRVKWMMFHDIDSKKFYNHLKSIFPKSKQVLFGIVILTKLFPKNRLIERIALRLL